MTEKKKQEIQVFRTMRDNEFRCDGKFVTLPAEWVFVPSGDPGLTRRIKAATEYWCVVHYRKNRLESQGLCCSGAVAEAEKAKLEKERSDPAYLRKLENARRRRREEERLYAGAFEKEVLRFLNFAPVHAALAARFATLVAAHAVPVGSGTVARTERIPIERRAEAAVIAWMRHQTTAYDHLHIARIKGERRAVRRELASHSRELLSRYRAGLPITPDDPLFAALQKSTPPTEKTNAEA